MFDFLLKRFFIFRPLLLLSPFVCSLNSKDTKKDFINKIDSGNTERV